MAEQRSNDTGTQPPPAFTARITDEGSATVVRLTGELDMSTVAMARPVIEDAVARGRTIVIDLSGLTFFSSAGLSLLVDLHQRSRATSLAVYLVADQRVVLLPLDVAGLRDLFPVHVSVVAALAAAG